MKRRIVVSTLECFFFRNVNEKMKSRGNRKQKRSRKRPRRLRGGWGADLDDIRNKLKIVQQGEKRGGIPDKRLTAAQLLYAAVEKLQNCLPEDGEKTNADDVWFIKRFALDIVRNCEHLLQNYNRMYKYHEMLDPERNTFIDDFIEHENSSKHAIEGIASSLDKLRPCNEYGVPKSAGAEMFKPFNYEKPTPPLELTPIFLSYEDKEGELDRRVQEGLPKRAPADEPKAKSSKFDLFDLTRRLQPRVSPSQRDRMASYKPAGNVSANVLADASRVLTQPPPARPQDRMTRWKSKNY